MLELDKDLLEYLDAKAEPQKDFQPEIDSLKKEIESLKAMIEKVSAKLNSLTETTPDKKQTGQADIFYRADGKIKSFKIGSMGALVVRDGDGKMRGIKFDNIA